MNILLTGASGLLGRHALSLLRGNGHKVIPVARTRNAGPDTVLMDLCDPCQVANLPRQIDCVVHLAAQLPSPKTKNEHELWLQINTVATLNLLEFCAHSGIRNFIYGSTWSVYGDAVLATPIIEQTPPKPTDFYSLSKLAGEILAEPYVFYHRLNVKSLRFSYLYGVGMRQDTAIEIFLARAQQGQDITLIHNGAEVTDLLFVEDAARAIEAALGPGTGTYNIGSGVPVTFREIAETVVKLTGEKSALIPAHVQNVVLRKRYLSIEKASRELGWSPVNTLESGLSEFIRSRKTRGLS